MRRRRGNNYKYLGKKVADVRGKGLDTVKEFREIKRAILQEVQAGRLDPRTAHGRLLLLYRLSYKKNNSKIQHISNNTLRQLRKELKRAMRRVYG